jgi:hypothetical protein
MSNDLEALVTQELQVCLSIEMAPEHRGAQPTLRVVVLGKIASTKA